MDSFELESAVASGVITPDIARRLRNFSAERHDAPAADEERFGVVGGMADVMTAIGLSLLLGGCAAALGWLGPAVTVPLLAAIWLFAEYFTRQRKMTLTSFALFSAFAVSAACFFLMVAILVPDGGVHTSGPVVGSPGALPFITPLRGIVVATGTTLACWLYWWRFELPLAFTASMVAAINVGVHLLRMIVPQAPATLVSLVLLATGLLLFALAMWWDISDVRRETRRADIAFWLHCAAGFQLAGATFRLLLGVTGDLRGWDRLYGFTSNPPSASGAIAVLMVFAAFCLVALAVDRRSLMLSSLGYAFPAALKIIGGDVDPGDLPEIVLVTIILTGIFLVILAVRWRSLRRLVLSGLPPELRANLPRTDLTYARERPVA